MTEQMLDLAAVAPGDRVLDIGCGSGEQTVIAARRVGETGHVFAIDIAAPMVAATAKNVATAGLRNVTTRVCPADELSAEGAFFDAAISRLLLPLRVPFCQSCVQAAHSPPSFQAIRLKQVLPPSRWISRPPWR